MEPGRREGHWTLDMSPDNGRLYRGCAVTRVGGRPVVGVTPDKGVVLVGRNALRLAEAIPRGRRKRLALVGEAPTWAVVAVFHMLHVGFDRVTYDDGGGRVVLSQFGY